jgi:energy-converting hydrogenase Eha subunit H
MLSTCLSLRAAGEKNGISMLTFIVPFAGVLPCMQRNNIYGTSTLLVVTLIVVLPSMCSKLRQENRYRYSLEEENNE